jgi:hypothetical protein
MSNIVDRFFSKPKSKTEEWYRERVAEMMPTIHFTIDNYDKMKMAYDIYNDDLSAIEKTFKEWCDPLGATLKEYKPVAYPVIHNKVNILKGELLKRPNDYSIAALSEKALIEKNDEIKKSISAKVEQSVNKLIEVLKEDTSPEELQEIIRQETQRIQPEDIDIKHFQTEWEIFFDFAIKHCIQTQNVKYRKLETLEDTMNANSLFVFSGWKNGKPYLEVRNPLFLGFHKSGNVKYVNKGEYVYYRKVRTFSDIYQDYKHDLTKEELESLKNRYPTALNKYHDVLGGKKNVKYQFDTLDAEYYLSNYGDPDKNVAEFSNFFYCL